MTSNQIEVLDIPVRNDVVVITYAPQTCVSGIPLNTTTTGATITRQGIPIRLFTNGIGFIETGFYQYIITVSWDNPGGATGVFYVQANTPADFDPIVQISNQTTPTLQCSGITRSTGSTGLDVVIYFDGGGPNRTAQVTVQACRLTRFY